MWRPLRVLRVAVTSAPLHQGGPRVDYATATDMFARHLPRYRLLRLSATGRCRCCRQSWPCAQRRQAVQAILDALNAARHS
jgi:hypothetical protein